MSFLSNRHVEFIGKGKRGRTKGLKLSELMDLMVRNRLNIRRSRKYFIDKLRTQSKIQILHYYKTIRKILSYHRPYTSSEISQDPSEMIIYTNFQRLNYIQSMPRLQTLSAIQPNKYYNIEATLKYTHISNQKITAIIQQDNIQKKIMLPMTNIPLQLGCSYSFQKCFYSKNGWIRLNQSENIKLLQDGSAQYIELSQIYQHRAALNNCYVSTIVEIISIGEQETFVKNGQELRLVKMKVFANDMLAEVSIWNQQLSPLILIGQKVTLSGFRVKTITPKSVSLTSTVYSALHVVQGESISSFDAKANYQNISQIYINRTLAQMTSDTASENITHSLLHAHVQEVMAFDYEGCLKCRKKLQTEQCPVCNQKVKGKLVVMQLILSDESGSQMVYVFDNNLLGLFKLCKKGTTLDIKLKSTKRTMEEQDTISHIITNVVSIYF